MCKGAGRDQSDAADMDYIIGRVAVQNHRRGCQPLVTSCMMLPARSLALSRVHSCSGRAELLLPDVSCCCQPRQRVPVAALFVLL